MTLLAPLGLLGLLSIVALIIIYIIKPNYQQKFISSTFVWKLSLKYRKKKLPTSKLRNILLIICQILVLLALTTILANPATILKSEVSTSEVVAIIDSSASMRTQKNEETRFERAIFKATELVETTLTNEGLASVIIGGPSPEFLFERNSLDNLELAKTALNDLTIGNTACSYGVSDMDAAITLSESVLDLNPKAKIYIYTDVTYAYVPEGIEVVNVCDEENTEWNVSILDAKTKTEDNFQTVYIDTVSYGTNNSYTIYIDVYGANNDPSTQNEGFGLQLSYELDLVQDTVTTIVLKPITTSGMPENEDDVIYFPLTGEDRFYNFTSIHVYYDEDDSFREDNSFDIYGGQKEHVSVQYCSPEPNKYVPAAINAVASSLTRLDIEKSEKKPENCVREGQNMYIFEKDVPLELPTDGVVFLINPEGSPVNAGFSLRGEGDFGTDKAITIEDNVEHPILNGLTMNEAACQRIKVFNDYDDEYQVLLTCGNYPVLMIKDDGATKIVVLTISTRYSNIVTLYDFPVMFYNIFDYFFPATVVDEANSNSHSYEIGESVSVASRGDKITINGAEYVDKEYTEFPVNLVFSTPGTYRFTQTDVFGRQLDESIFVRVPESECNIFEQGGSLYNPFRAVVIEEFYADWILYVAAALVALLFIEWFLQLRDSM